MALGDRIRFFRSVRGITQLALGRLLGYSDVNADTRIANYESGRRMPKYDTIQNIAGALKISPAALISPNFDSSTGLFHSFIQLEDEFAIQISSIDGKICMTVNPEKTNAQLTAQIMMEWHEQYSRFCRGEITQEEYNQWRYTHE